MVEMNASNLRRESRVRSRGLIEIGLGGRHPIAGTIRDVSVWGIGVETRSEIPPGTAVRVIGTGFTADAIVRNCVGAGASFQIGLELLPGG